MLQMPGRRYRNSVAEEDGGNKGPTWTEGGQRRQAGTLVGLHGLYSCPPGRSVLVSHPRDTCAPCSSIKLGWLRVGESAWLGQEKVDATSSPRVDRFTPALPIGYPCLCLAALGMGNRAPASRAGKSLRHNARYYKVTYEAVWRMIRAARRR
jgi:hypothetical protein